MSHSISGHAINLAAGHYSATILTVGAALGSLTHDGHDLVLRSRVDKLSDAFLGKTLVPWPNRVAGGGYPWGDRMHYLPVNDLPNNAALHGLLCWQEWQVVDARADSVTLTAFLAPRPGYEWPLECTTTFHLDPDEGLGVTIDSVNVGAEAAPYGVASHPYICLGGRPADTYELTVPAELVYTMDDNQVPGATVPVSEGGADFRTTRRLGRTALDHPFTGFPDGVWTIRVTEPSSGLGVELSSDVRYAQLYSADAIGRTALAVEPMSCAPNAFNTGDGLVRLAPGEGHSFHYALRAFTHSSISGQMLRSADLDEALTVG